jgi:alkanesulfonate monooxygenase SsuD/methylene tetrahydromethanopterin reductase-like flavin-dependent oxidoreductase (luciferase family)
VRIGVSIADFSGTSGPRLGSDLAAVGRALDDAGFDLIGVMDHFFQIGGIGPPEADMLEAYTTLGYLAASTSRARLLTVVTGVPYRYPGVLA